MKTIEVGNIEGIGECELREPSISKIESSMHLMGDRTQEFMLKVLEVSLYSNGELVENALDKIGLSELTRLTPLLTNLLGFSDEAEDEGND